MKCLSLVACGGAAEIQMTAPGKDIRALSGLGHAALQSAMFFILC